jgi:hypothetical protein
MILPHSRATMTSHPRTWLRVLMGLCCLAIWSLAILIVHTDSPGSLANSLKFRLQIFKKTIKSEWWQKYRQIVRIFPQKTGSFVQKVNLLMAQTAIFINSSTKFLAVVFFDKLAENK